MPVPTSHPAPRALPVIDAALCATCGDCAAVCPTTTLAYDGSQISVQPETWLGCLGCGQCMCACPTGAVRVQGRGADEAQLVLLPAPAMRATAAQLEALLLARRSIRAFDSREVEPAAVQQILAAAALAPMGIPPSEVRMLVLAGRTRVRQFTADMDACFRGARGFFKSPMMAGLKLMMKREQRQQMEQFIIPLTGKLVEARERQQDWLLYDAPLAILFYSLPYADANDAPIAATYAMLAAAAQGLGTCLIGTVGPFLQRNAKLMDKYGLPRGARLGLTLIAGYPARRFVHALRRRGPAVPTA